MPLWERADSGSAAQPAAFPCPPSTFSGMDPRWQPPLDHCPSPTDPSPEARALFAAGWYATRDECRLVNPADRAEQLVSPETWRALRELGANVPVKRVAQPAG